MKWELGRQGTGYKKITLLENKAIIPFDLHVIKYDGGDYIPPHTDPVPYGDHYRLNIVLWKSGKGGDFKCDRAILNWPRIKFFRPDIHEHSVTAVESGTRVVLSFGFILNRKRCNGKLA